MSESDTMTDTAVMGETIVMSDNNGHGKLWVHRVGAAQPVCSLLPEPTQSHTEQRPGGERTFEEEEAGKDK